MKFTSIISIILLSIYSVSTFVGIGIVRCYCTHSQRLVMMPVQPSCQCCNSSKSCCQTENKQPGKKHNCKKDCCSLIYKYVEVDQLSSTQFYDMLTKVLSLLFSPLLSVDDLMVSIKEYATIKINSPPPGLLKIPLIYMHGQLRL